jgi:hypothetical protein
MILISDVNVVPRPYIVSNFNAEMADDSAASSNQATVSNLDNRIRNAFLTGHHARGQGDVWTNQRIRPDLNVLLIKNRGRLPHNQTSLTESTKTLASRIRRRCGGTELYPAVESNV